MYTKTLSKTITEATDKLVAMKTLFNCTIEQLTNAQRYALNKFLDLLDYCHDDATEDRKLALENLYVDLFNDNIYVLEMADDRDDDISYYYTEIIPKIMLYQDDKGNLWNLVGYDADTQAYEVTVVEEDDGHYIDTSITWLMTQQELNECTQIFVEER